MTASTSGGLGFVSMLARPLNPLLTMTAKKAFCALCVLALAACSSLPGPSAASEHALMALGKDYVGAQFSFDQAALARMTAPKFVEVSPKGEVDEREAFIGFYAADKKGAAPPYRVLDQRVRVTGSTAVVTQTLEMGSSPRLMRMTQALSAAYVDGRWVLTSSQTTPLPPAKAP